MQEGSASITRSKHVTASSWLNAYAHTSPRLNQSRAAADEVVTGRV